MVDPAQTSPDPQPRDPTQWRVIGASTLGAGHRQRDEPCQDHHLLSWLGEGDRQALVLAVADGAGSARHAEQGSRLAVAGLRDAVEQLLARERLPSQIEDPDTWRWALLRVRLGLQEHAMEHRLELRDLACTLLAVVIDRAGAVCLQLGDGFILYGKQHEYLPVFRPTRGEFANETVFVSSTCWWLLFRLHVITFRQLDASYSHSLDGRRRQSQVTLSANRVLSSAVASRQR